MKEQTEEVRTLLQKGRLSEIEKILSGVKQWNKELMVIHILIQVFRREAQNGISPTVFAYSRDLDTLTGHFIRLKLYIRRLEFDMPHEAQMELYEYCRLTGVSDYLLLYIIQKNTFFPVKVCRGLSALFAEAEGAESFRAGLYRDLAEQMKE